MKNRLCTSLLFFLVAFMGHSQVHQHVVDSILRVLPPMADDTNKVKAILSLCDHASYYDLKKEKDYALMGLELARRINNNRGQGAFNNIIGIYYEQLGDYQNAIRFYLESQRFNEKAGNLKGQAISLMNSGNVYYRMKNYPEAIINHTRALELFTKAGSKRGQADCYMNIGSDYAAFMKHDSAIVFYNRSLVIREQIHDVKGIAQTLNNLGEEALESGNMEEALEDLTRARDIKTSLADTNGLANTFLEFADYYLKKNDHPKALRYCDSAYRFASTVFNSELRMQSYKKYFIIYEHGGDLRLALKYHKAYSDLKDSIFSDESSSSIARMQTLYETEKKEKENELLKERSKISDLESGRKDDEIRKQRYYIITAVAGLALMILLALFIFRGYRDKRKAHRIISLQKQEVERQRDLVEEKQTEILDSITYAKRIQGALLASDGLLNKNLPDHFIFYRPKDIVSGDFYWATELPDCKFMLLTGDCTGHGVPGAFMSLLNITLLNKIVIEHRIVRPDDVLNEVRRDIIRALNPEMSGQSSYDGMDCSLIVLDMKNKKLAYAAAMNPVLVVRKNEVLELKADKQPVGFSSEMTDFSYNLISLEPGDMIYTFTDGYADQFGGEKGKKFRFARMKELLLSIAPLPAEVQKRRIESEFDEWKKNIFQVDDVLVIGIRV